MAKPKEIEYICMFDVPKSKKISNYPITVDCFKLRISDCQFYFLSHFHADHYYGLTKSFPHKIYCSRTTAALVSYRIGCETIPLEMYTNYSIGNFVVRLIEANHCPGAVMFIFLIDGRFYLHTGDFRYSEIYHSFDIYRDSMKYNETNNLCKSESISHFIDNRQETKFYDEELFFGDLKETTPNSLKTEPFKEGNFIHIENTLKNSNSQELNNRTANNDFETLDYTIETIDHDSSSASPQRHHALSDENVNELKDQEDGKVDFYAKSIIQSPISKSTSAISDDESLSFGDIFSSTPDCPNHLKHKSVSNSHKECKKLHDHNQQTNYLLDVNNLDKHWESVLHSTDNHDKIQIFCRSFLFERSSNTNPQNLSFMHEFLVHKEETKSINNLLPCGNLKLQKDVIKHKLPVLKESNSEAPHKHYYGIAESVFSSNKVKDCKSDNSLGFADSIAHKNIKFESVYLDNTYEGFQAFESQKSVINKILGRLDQKGTLCPRNICVLCVTYCIGKEKVFLSIAEYLDKNVQVSAEKMEIYKCFSEYTVDQINMDVMNIIEERSAKTSTYGFERSVRPVNIPKNSSEVKKRNSKKVKREPNSSPEPLKTDNVSKNVSILSWIKKEDSKSSNKACEDYSGFIKEREKSFNEDLESLNKSSSHNNLQKSLVSGTVSIDYRMDEFKDSNCKFKSFDLENPKKHPFFIKKDEAVNQRKSSKPFDRITTNESQIKVIGFHEVKNIEKIASSIVADKIYVLVGSGWNEKTVYKNYKRPDGKVIKKGIELIYFRYSEHSSSEELKMFLNNLNVKNVIRTVK